MKVKINVECTPEEARVFLGLPDVTPMQDDMMARMREQMDTAAAAMDPEQMMKAIFPSGLVTGFPGGLPGGAEGLAEMQKMFWSSFTGENPSGAQAGGSGKKKK